jgi:hypothetical protein
MIELKECHWFHDDEDGAFDTQCDQRFTLNEGTPEDNYMNYCPFCGGKLIVDREEME